MRQRAKKPSATPHSTLRVQGGRRRHRLRCVTRSLLVLSCVVVALGSSASSALGARYEHAVSFGPEGTSGAATFKSLQGIAVDQASGSVYVLDAAEGGRLYKFASSGAPSNFSGLSGNVISEVGGREDGPGTGAEDEVAVAPVGAPGGTGGDIYVATGSQVEIYAPDGGKLGALSGAEYCGVAVDPAGHVLVGQNPEKVREFTPTANPVVNSDETASSTASLQSICNVAADGLGNIYATNFGGATTEKLEGIADPTATRIQPGGVTMAIDPATHDLFLDRLVSVSVYGVDGEQSAEFGSGQLSESRGIAIGRDAEAAYVGNGTSGKVEIYENIYAPLAVAVTEPASGLSENSATLDGGINAAAGPEAICAFQYVGGATFILEGFSGAATVPCEPSGPFSGETVQSVHAHLSGLFAGSEYYFRLLATNENGTSHGPTRTLVTVAGATVSSGPFGPCPNDSLRTGLSSLLPDCRAFEQATSVDKNGGGAEGFPDYIKASSGGTGFTFYSQAGVPSGGTAGAQDFPTFLATRGEGSWSTQGLLPPQSFGPSASVLGYSADLRYVVTRAELPGSGPGTGAGLFIEDTAAHSIATVVPYNRKAHSADVYAVDGISPDGSEVFFESEVALATGAIAEKPNLYVWSRGSGAITVAGVLPGVAKSPPAGSFGGPYDWFSVTPDTSRGGAQSGFYVAESNAISPSGDQIYFTAGETGQLYLRRGLTTPNPTTAAVSVPNPGVSDPNGAKPAAFQLATADGSEAFFLSSEKLTVDANTGTSDQGQDLYSYSAEAGDLTDLTPDPSGNGAEVQGVLGASDDGSSVYFAANGILAPGAAVGNCDNQAVGNDGISRSCNLYHYEDSTGTPQITFISSLSGSGGFSASESNDTRDWSSASHDPNGNNSRPTGSTARVSGGGQTVLFSSVRSLTGFDNLAPGCLRPGSAPLEPCHEVFRYSAGTGELVCVSCDPAGGAAVGSAALSSSSINSFNETSGVRTAVKTRNLSSDGDRIFFETPDALVTNDENGASGCTLTAAGSSCQDVYEWEAPDPADNSDTCTTEKANFVQGSRGCIYLLTSGDSPEPSYFGDADADGNNVFIFTQSQLVTTDRDQLFDIYDVRTDGGIVSQQEVPGEPCSGETSCLGAGQPPTPESSPGSASFNGSGNPKFAPACKKGYVKKHGQCAKKHRKKKHKKSKKKRHKRRRKSGSGDSKKGGSK
jgi:hypothetical protein